MWYTVATPTSVFYSRKKKQKKKKNRHSVYKSHPPKKDCKNQSCNCDLYCGKYGIYLLILMYHGEDLAVLMASQVAMLNKCTGVHNPCPTLLTIYYYTVIIHKKMLTRCKNSTRRQEAKPNSQTSNH